jgi:hypothetical protein
MLVPMLGSSCTDSNLEQHRVITCQFFPELEPAVGEQTSDGGIVLSRQSLPNASFEPEGLGTILIDDRGLYFVERKGKTAPALHFDNGADWVVEGLARTVKNGKSGYHQHSVGSSCGPLHGISPPRSVTGSPKSALGAFPLLNLEIVNIR